VIRFYSRLYRPLRQAWALMLLALGLVAATQLQAGLALRGLFADGVFYTVRMLGHHGLAIMEPERGTAQLMVQAPVAIGMLLGLDDARKVALLFSLTTNLTPVLLTFTCLWVLPTEDRRFFLFPIFVFLGGSMGSAFASIADGATAAAYAWLLLFLLLFGPLTRCRHAAILLLSLGTLRLHEATAFLGPLLLIACLQRRAIAPIIERGWLLVAAGLLAASSVLGLTFFLVPRSLGNRTSFLTDLLDLRWLFASGQGLNLPMALGLCGLLAAFVSCLRLLRQLSVIVFIVLAAGLTAAAVFGALPSTPAAAFAARNNGPLLSLPAMALCLFLRRFPTSWPNTRAPLLIGATLAASLAVINLRATIDWSGYRNWFEASLPGDRSIIPWNKAVSELPSKKAASLDRFTWPWTNPLMSLVLAPPGPIGTVLANRSTTGWQPFDPGDAATWPKAFRNRDALPTTTPQRPVTQSHCASADTSKPSVSTIQTPSAALRPLGPSDTEP
jgi:hypothetical protein